MSELTRILNSPADRPGERAEQILPLVYSELRRLAQHKMAHEPAGHTLQATALVHEAWLRVNGPNEVRWNGRNHFFSAAAEAMRRILVEHARRKLAQKHGGGQARLDIDAVEIPEEQSPEKLLSIHEALDELAAEAPDQAEVVKLRFFVGMSHAEIASALGISEKTSKRYWAHAKAWLCQRIKENL
ncbi:MAG: sigma-70 family RNA polymerase sigma factor [Verrucomicrobia bacterium]|nr:sigma-70 family RNA polymerase sigma factor [Verrucomicrobiota bacterium]